MDYGGCQYRIASGMAYLGIDGDTYEEIFQVADNRMYRNKAELKRVKHLKTGEPNQPAIATINIEKYD